MNFISTQPRIKHLTNKTKSLSNKKQNMWTWKQEQGSKRSHFEFCQWSQRSYLLIFFLSKFRVKKKVLRLIILVAYMSNFNIHLRYDVGGIS